MKRLKTMAKLNDIKKALDDVFVARNNGLEGSCFNSEYMKSESEHYGIYKAISKAQHDSNLSFEFSYIIAGLAVDILKDVDWSDDDEITSLVDTSVPIYTNELMEIYKANSWAVDDAVRELGSGDSEQNAKYGWYMQIESMVNAIKNNLLKLVDEDEE